MDRGIGRLGGVIAVLVIVVAGVGGAFAMGLLGVPAVDGVDNRFAGVNATTTLVETALTVRNPNPVGARLGGLTIGYTVWLNDVPVANGSKRGLSVEAGTSTVSFTTAMTNDRIPAWWVSHVRNGEHTVVRVDATVTSGLLDRSADVTPVERPVDTDVLSAFNSSETRPVDANAPLVSDPVLYVNETSAAWGDVSAEVTPIEMAFVVYNPKPVPYAISKVGYTITMNGVRVGEGETARGYAIPPRAERTVEATTEIRNGRLDEWWVSHLENDQVTELRIEFSATIELPSGQTVEVPLDRLTYTETIETDFFGNEADTGDRDGGTGPADDPTPTARPTTDRETPTPPASDLPTTEPTEPTPTSTSVPTPTPTPTPDGGLPIGDETDTGVL